MRRRSLLLLALGTLLILVGQVGRELLPPDDLREAEVAREMLVDGDVVIPHLAGLPFVEKPPGFPALVASAFWLAGGPGVTAGRSVAALFALASLVFVFLLGRRMFGPEEAALAAALLALASRFCRTAHELLLDNALTAAMALAILLGWLAVSTAEIRSKRRAYAGVALVLGLSFLVKGVVGPGLFAAGFGLFLVLDRRLGELRHAVRPPSLVAFLVPVLAWIVPFLRRAPPELVREFLVDNQIGRAFTGYASQVHGIAFYALDLLPAFAPASVFLPFAAVAAWRARRSADRTATLFLLSLGLGPLLLLSLARAKSSVYLLPAYPALALLTASWCARQLDEATSGRRAALGAVLGACALAASAATAATAILGGTPLRIAIAASLALLITLNAATLLHRRDLHGAAAGAACLVALAWTLYFTGPIASLDIATRSDRAALEQALAIAGDRDLLLFRPSDGIRGGAGFYRRRTAMEVRTPAALVGRLAADKDAAVLLREKRCGGLPADLLEAAGAAGVELGVLGRVPQSGDRFLAVVSAR